MVHNPLSNQDKGIRIRRAYLKVVLVVVDKLSTSLLGPGPSKYKQTTKLQIRKHAIQTKTEASEANFYVS